MGNAHRISPACIFLAGQHVSHFDYDVKKIVAEVARQIMVNVKYSQAVTVKGLGTFKPVDKAARTCRNPSTGAEIQVPAKRVLAFMAVAGNKDI